MVAVVVGSEEGVSFDRDHELGEVAVPDDPPELLLGDEHAGGGPPLPLVRLLRRLGELERPLELGGGSLLVSQGIFIGVVAPSALGTIGRQPSVPRPRDPLRGLPPIAQLSCLPPHDHFVRRPLIPIHIAAGGPTPPMVPTEEHATPRIRIGQRSLTIPLE
jgi:hypothetical protein